MIGQVSYYSIDPLNQSLFVMNTADDLLLKTVNDPQDIIKSIRLRGIVELVAKMLDDGIDNFVVRVLPSHQGDFHVTEFVSVGIPNEHDLMAHKIQELENRLRIYNDFIAKPQSLSS